MVRDLAAKYGSHPGRRGMAKQRAAAGGPDSRVQHVGEFGLGFYKRFDPEGTDHEPPFANHSVRDEGSQGLGVLPIRPFDLANRLSMPEKLGEWQWIGEYLPYEVLCHFDRTVQFQIRVDAPKTAAKYPRNPVDSPRLRRWINGSAMRQCFRTVHRHVLEEGRASLNLKQRRRLDYFFKELDRWSFEAESDLDPRTHILFHLRTWEVCDGVASGMGRSGLRVGVGTAGPSLPPVTFGPEGQRPFAPGPSEVGRYVLFRLFILFDIPDAVEPIWTYLGPIRTRGRIYSVDLETDLLEMTPERKGGEFEGKRRGGIFYNPGLNPNVRDVEPPLSIRVRPAIRSSFPWEGAKVPPARLGWLASEGRPSGNFQEQGVPCLNEKACVAMEEACGC